MRHALDICAVALIVEAAIGYPEALFRRIGHPVTWIGAALSALDRRLNGDDETPARRRLAGAGAILVLLAVTGALSFGLGALADAVLPRPLAIAVLGIVASSCLAQRSLHAHVRAVADALDSEGIDAGRRAVAMIVGRDHASLDAAAICRAAIESLAENFADGIVAPTFWLALGGLPGGMLYKAVNTADSMIGHRTPRHEAFGSTAAKLDDAVNWPAARLAALAIVGAAALTPGASARDAWRIARRDASGHPSPNAGWPEAAMAGALGLGLGGHRAYCGRLVEDRGMGDGPKDIGTGEIRRALRLYRTACAINVAVIMGAALLALA